MPDEQPTAPEATTQPEPALPLFEGALAYAEAGLRMNQETFGRRYLFLFGMHAVNNGLVVLTLPFV